MLLLALLLIICYLIPPSSQVFPQHVVSTTDSTKSYNLLAAQQDKAYSSPEPIYRFLFALILNYCFFIHGWFLLGICKSRHTQTDKGHDTWICVATHQNI